MCRYYRYSCMFSKRFRILQIHLSACITKIKHFAILVFTFLISSMSVLTPPPTRNCLLLCLFLFLLLLYKNQHSCGNESAINSAFCNTQYPIWSSLATLYSEYQRKCWKIALFSFDQFLNSAKWNKVITQSDHRINCYMQEVGNWTCSVCYGRQERICEMAVGEKVLEGVIRSTWANYANAVVALLSHVIILYIAPLYVNNI